MWLSVIACHVDIITFKPATNLKDDLYKKPVYSTSVYTGQQFNPV